MTAEAAPPPHRARAPRWMWIVLIASLALNLAFIGVIAGASLSWRYGAAAHGPGGPNLMQFAQQLPSERRAEVRRLAAQRRPLLMPLRREVRQARQEAARALLAEPFDKAQFRAAQQRLAEAEGRMRQAGLEAFAEVAAMLTPEERRQFVSWRSARMMRGGFGGAMGGDDDATEPVRK